MTTVAYKDGVIAADTGFVLGECLAPGIYSKIARNRHGDLAGFCGAASVCRVFLEWFREASGNRVPPCDDFKETAERLDRAIVIARSNHYMIKVIEPDGWFVVEAPFFAIGSGKAEALGAMYAGGTAHTAVAAARQFDPHTSGKIAVLTHGCKEIMIGHPDGETQSQLSGSTVIGQRREADPHAAHAAQPEPE